MHICILLYIHVIVLYYILASFQKINVNVNVNNFIIHYIRSTETVFNLPLSKSFTLVFMLFKLARALTSLLMPSFSTSVFKTIKALLAAKSDVSVPVAYSYSFLVA